MKLTPTTSLAKYSEICIKDVSDHVFQRANSRGHVQRPTISVVASIFSVFLWSLEKLPSVPTSQ